MSRQLKYSLYAFGLIIFIGFAIKGRIPYERFDSEKWKNFEESETTASLRWDMMNSLRNNYELDGMTKGEILDLLGQPERQDKLEFRYFLGMAKHGIDTGSLVIRFNDQDIVVRFYVWKG